ncbi:MAG: hypothetical protein ACP5OA_02930 [Candidatus Woesearchaeota archaeon]
MIKHQRRGAIELSANFLVVIIISIVILVGGLTLFFKLIGNLNDTASALDSQTEDQVKHMMLNTGGRVAVYPSDPIIPVGDAAMVGVGVNNMLDMQTVFTVLVASVMFYDETNGGMMVSNNPIYDDYCAATSYDLSVSPGSQGVMGILLKIPTGSSSGQYIYTIQVWDPLVWTAPYGTVQVFVNVP